MGFGFKVLYLFVLYSETILFRHMLTSHLTFYCPKAYHRPKYSIRATEHHRNKILFQLSIFTGIRNQEILFFGIMTSRIFLTEKNNFDLVAVLPSCLVFKQQKLLSQRLELRKR
jgi:hypothetical protein